MPLGVMYECEMNVLDTWFLQCLTPPSRKLSLATQSSVLGFRGGAPQIFHWLNHDINTYLFRTGLCSSS